MRRERKALLAGAGGVGAAFGSALCCAGPLIAVAAGVSGAGLAATFDPLRPWFLAATAAFLLLGFWMVDREERKACEPGRPCADAPSHEDHAVERHRRGGGVRHVPELAEPGPVAEEDGVSRKEWIAVIIVIGLGIVWQIPRQDDPMPAGGEQHVPSPAQVEDAEQEGAAASTEAAEAAGPYRTIALEVTGMT